MTDDDQTRCCQICGQPETEMEPLLELSLAPEVTWLVHMLCQLLRRARAA